MRLNGRQKKLRRLLGLSGPRLWAFDPEAMDPDDQIHCYSRPRLDQCLGRMTRNGNYLLGSSPGSDVSFKSLTLDFLNSLPGGLAGAVVHDSILIDARDYARVDAEFTMKLRELFADIPESHVKAVPDFQSNPGYLTEPKTSHPWRSQW